MEKKNRTDFIKIRVTKEEKDLIKKKAKNYPSLSSYVFDAVMNYDDKYSICIFDNLSAWSEQLESWKSFYQKLGNNINQLAKYENQLAKEGILNQNIIEKNMELKKECIVFLSQVSDFQSYIKRRIKNII